MSCHVMSCHLQLGMHTYNPYTSVVVGTWLSRTMLTMDTHGELQAPEDVSDSNDEDEADLHHLITSTGNEPDNSDDEE